MPKPRAKSSTKRRPPGPKDLMIERGSPRGLVPNLHFGAFDISYNEYLAKLDPRGDSEQSEAVRFALASASDKRFQTFFERLQDPTCKRYTLATIAKYCDISLPQMAEFWNKAQKMRALVKAQEGIVSFIPDMVEEAHTQDLACDRCDGFGFVYVEDQPADPKLGIKPLRPDDPASRMIRTCPNCKGTGRSKKEGNPDSRKQLLEMTGMVGRGGGASVKLVQNFGGSTMESAVERMNRVTFEVGDDVVDGVAEEVSDSEK